MAFQKNSGLNWECFQCIEILQFTAAVLFRRSPAGTGTVSLCWQRGCCGSKGAAEQPFKHWWWPKSRQSAGMWLWDRGFASAEKLLLQHLSAAQDGGQWTTWHFFFAVSKQTAEVQLLFSTALFKKDAVRVRSNGTPNLKSQVFSVASETLWTESGLSNCALNAWGFSWFFPTVLVI